MEMDHKTKSKRSLIIIILLIFVGLPTYYIPRFLFELGNKGGPQCSGSIERAKELGVFVAEYKLSKDSINLNSNYKFKPGEIWVEKLWVRGTYDNPVKIVENRLAHRFTLYFEIPSDDLELVKQYIRNDYLAMFAFEIEIQFGVYKHGETSFLRGNYYKSLGSTIKLDIILADSSEINFSPKNWKNPTVIDSFSIIKQ